LAVAKQLKALQPEIRVVFVGQKGDPLMDIPSEDPNIDAVYGVRAGKFRRYHGAGWKQLFDIPTVVKNMRDLIWVLVGIWQSWRVLGKVKPAAIFTRGGFVSVPVAFGGRLRHIPYITHDSDALPSLANRLIAKGARMHAVALPKEVYPYPADKTVTTGVPTSADFVPVTDELRAVYLTELGLQADDQLLFVTGGGNGAQSLNAAVIRAAETLLERNPRLHIIHAAGRGNQAAVEQGYTAQLGEEARQRVRVEGFVKGLHRYSGAADVVIARAGATNLAEYAIQGASCIIVPATQLTGGHQVKNAVELAKAGAIVQLDQKTIESGPVLADTIQKLLNDAEARAALSRSFQQFAHPNASQEIAQLILDIAKQGAV
jgi:UDP-N-acetylglucosamine--N-acetylmuramyl-(pentapeptide) pyrophosphoryl-undecaprenol N-acetylglucosamine transferase